MRSHTRALLAVVLLLPIASAGRAGGPGLVVAVDTSRSLRPVELGAATTLAAGVLAALPASAAAAPTTAVVAFDDSPRWAASPGSSAEEAGAALRSLAPSGSYTLLHDALFVAVRSLADGGVVLLLTDGRDENSATTLEDVARACEANGVRVLAVGLGQRVEERALRRLALLTGGAYLGRVEQVEPGELAAATAEAMRRPPTRRAVAVPGTPDAATAGLDAGASETVPAALRTTTAGGAPAASEEPRPALAPRAWRWWLLAPLALLALGTPVAVWATRRRGAKGPATTWCRRCGSEYPEGGECPQCEEVGLQQRLRSREMARLEDTGEFELGVATPAVTAPFDPDAIEQTRVLTDQSVLLVREPGEPQRSYLLRADGAFAVGRDPRGNTLALRDLALSAHHLKVVAEEGRYYIVDLDSTNGSYLNQRRVRAARLSSGDVVRAGQVELEFRTFLSRVA
jgi:hypothetical protein